MEKSANQLYRESGTTQSFAEWIDERNKKMEKFNNASGEEPIVKKGGNKALWIALGVGVLAFAIWKMNEKK